MGQNFGNVLAALSITALLVGSFLQASEVEVMRAESVVFCEDLQPRTAKLLFEPTKILSVQRANQSEVYEEGVDYTVHARTLQLTENSRIPVLTFYSQAKDNTLYRFKEPKGFIYSPGGVTKHNAYDIEVSYEYEKGTYADFFAGCAASDTLTVFDKLNAGEPVTIAFFGDSITVGAQASGALEMKAAPGRDGYARLVFNALQTQFPNAQMSYINQAVGGKETNWGLKHIGGIVDVEPDLLVLAFGMNDGRKSSEAYLRNTKDMVAKVRQRNPAVSIVLVAEFSPNPNLAMAKYDKRKQNRDELFALQQEMSNCAVVDVGKVSRAMVALKKFCDLSGNNVNHPNDFLHQVYADAVLYSLGYANQL